MQPSFVVNAAAGIVEPAKVILSPNCDARPEGAEPELIIIHGISFPPGEFGGTEIEDFFMNRLDTDSHPYFKQLHGLKVSAHLLIRRDGELIQFVPFTQRAWHAGESEFCARKNCNDFSIGIELEGDDDTPYDDRQYDVLVAVLAALIEACPAISAREIAAHSDVAAGRKTDPGPVFDWLRLYDDLSAGGSGANAR